ncbi:MAG: ABC transporter ATP-binding protein [Spirochaetales bacterium]|nr:ABC transporter ATP-binding protein [Spirochaetales bacterium]
MMTETVLEVKNLTKSYSLKAGGFSFSKERVHALSDVSFSIGKGKTLGLVGESGCGKTTTGRSLLRIIEPDRGKVFFNGSDTNFLSLPEKEMITERLKMQYIFQDPWQSLNPKQMVGRIITEAPLQHGLIKRENALEVSKKYLDIVGLPSEAARKYPHEFSGGQRQRINIARAIVMKPDFIVCDEPVSSLDVSIQSQILNLLLDIQQEFGTSYLFIAHNLSVVFYLSDEVAVMYAGKIVEKAPSRKLYEDPRHPYTKLLMAVAPKIDGKPVSLQPGQDGEVPSLTKLPKGCSFAERCPIASEECRRSIPPLKTVEFEHKVACFKAL